MTLDELAADHAELSETVAGLRALVEALAQQISNLPVPQITFSPQVSAPPQAAPNITVQAAAPQAGSFEIIHHWEGGRIVRSSITRKVLQ